MGNRSSPCEASSSTSRAASPGEDVVRRQHRRPLRRRRGRRAARATPSDPSVPPSARRTTASADRVPRTEPRSGRVDAPSAQRGCGRAARRPRRPAVEVRSTSAPRRTAWAPAAARAASSSGVMPPSGPTTTTIRPAVGDLQRADSGGRRVLVQHDGEVGLGDEGARRRRSSQRRDTVGNHERRDCLAGLAGGGLPLRVRLRRPLALPDRHRARRRPTARSGRRRSRSAPRPRARRGRPWAAPARR